MELFIPLCKVDEETRTIYGRGAQEVLDRSGEVMDYASSKAYFREWSDSVAKATGGKSLGNVRVMHQSDIAAGKLTQIDFNDDEKAVDVAVKVVDDAEWAKVQEGVYSGFSIGGSYVRKWDDPSMKKANGKPAVRYTANPNEISLVDRPCIPTAGFFEVRKADGTTENRSFKGEMMEGQNLSKSLWDAQMLLGNLDNLDRIIASVSSESKREGDESPATEELKAVRAKLAEVAAKYVAEEVGEDPDQHLIDFMESDEDEDEAEKAAINEGMEKGDYPGHPFRGNQYRRGGMSGGRHRASYAAHRASVAARSKNAGKKEHKAAAASHSAASAKARSEGRHGLANYHAARAQFHEAVSAGKFSRSEEAGELAKGGFDFDDMEKSWGSFHKSQLDFLQSMRKMCGAKKVEASSDEDAIAKALAPFREELNSLKKSMHATHAPVLRVVGKADDSANIAKADGADALAKAEAERDPLAAIRAIHSGRN